MYEWNANFPWCDGDGPIPRIIDLSWMWVGGTHKFFFYTLYNTIQAANTQPPNSQLTAPAPTQPVAVSASFTSVVAAIFLSSQKNNGNYFTRFVQTSTKQIKINVSSFKMLL